MMARDLTARVQNNQAARTGAGPSLADDILGWILHEPDPDAPFFTISGWLRWTLLDDHPPPCWCITHTDPPGPDAHAAARAFAHQETP